MTVFDEAKKKLKGYAYWGKNRVETRKVLVIPQIHVLDVIGDLQKTLSDWRKNMPELYYEDELGRGRIHKGKLLLWLTEFDHKFLEKAEKLLEAMK